MKYDICIIGGGFQGLVLAYYLSRKHKIVLIEEKKELGGVLSGFKLGKDYLEKYYHHFFTEDENLKQLLKELNLYKKVFWKVLKSGFYFKEKTYPFTSPIDLLKFKPLNFIDKLIFPLLVLKIKFANPAKIDNVSAKKWIIKNSSYNIYKKLFEPLIINKFGEENLEEVSAGWFVSRIKLRSKAKSGGEVLGYLNGGFQQLIDKLEEKIKENKGEIIKAGFIRFNKNNKKIVSAQTSKGVIKADKFISTIPPKSTFNFLELPGNYQKKVEQIKYQGSVCLVLGLKKSLSPIYWINLIGYNTPFKAVIEHTNLQAKKRYGVNVVYLASYYPVQDEIWKKTDKTIIKDYIKNLKKIFNIKDEDIEFKKLFKERYAGAIAKKNCLKNLLPLKTPFENLFILGMFSCYPERRLEIQVKLAKKLVKLIN